MISNFGYEMLWRSHEAELTNFVDFKQTTYWATIPMEILT